MKREEQIERVAEGESGRFVLDEGRRGIWSSSASCSLHPSCVLPLRRPFFIHRPAQKARRKMEREVELEGVLGEGGDGSNPGSCELSVCYATTGMLKRTISAREYKYILRERVK